MSEGNVTFSACNNCGAVNKVIVDKISDGPTCAKCKTKLPYEGSTLSLSADALNNLLLKSDKPVVIDFWASWCGPCQAYGPVFSRVADDLKGDAIFVKINTEKESALSAQMGVRGIPATVMFKDGVEVKRQAGAMQDQMLKSWVQN